MLPLLQVIFWSGGLDANCWYAHAKCRHVLVLLNCAPACGVQLLTDAHCQGTERSGTLFHGNDVCFWGDVFGGVFARRQYVGHRTFFGHLFVIVERNVLAVYLQRHR